MKKLFVLFALPFLALTVSFVLVACKGKNTQSKGGEDDCYECCNFEYDNEDKEEEKGSDHIPEFGNWTIFTHATCIAEGEEFRICKINNSHVETRPIPINSNAHDAGEWHLVDEPTTQSTGTRELRCTRCQGVISTETIPMLEPDTESAVGIYKHVNYDWTLELHENGRFKSSDNRFAHLVFIGLIITEGTWTIKEDKQIIFMVDVITGVPFTDDFVWHFYDEDGEFVIRSHHDGHSFEFRMMN